MAKPSNGSRKWPTSDWQGLLRDAIRLLDTLDGRTPWTFGGGTALAVHLNHRVSYDIDIFVPDAASLQRLSPQRNPATKALLGEHRFQYPGNYLKLELGRGEIDFIIGAAQTSDPTRAFAFEGRDILIETPWEIAIKKIFYRASTFMPRDLFDLAAVIERYPDELRVALPAIDWKLERLQDRIEAMAPNYEALCARLINPTRGGQKYMSRSTPEAVLDFLTSPKPHPGR